MAADRTAGVDQIDGCVLERRPAFVAKRLEHVLDEERHIGDAARRLQTGALPRGLDKGRIELQPDDGGSRRR